MAEEVKVPGVGKVPKQAAIAGVAVVAGAVGLYYYNKRKKASSTPAATATDQYPPDGTVGNPADPYSTDPATGQTYGDEAVGSGGTFGAYGGLGSGGGGWNPNTGMYTDPNGVQCQNPDANGYCPSPTGSNGPPFSSNSQWSGWVIQQMQANNPNIDVGGLTDAIGLYISGQPLTQTQAQFIYDAIAIGGNPPVAGANNYPPKIQLTNSPGGGTPAVNPVTGLKVTQSGSTGVDIAWDPSQNATSYTVKSTKGNPSMTGATTARIRSINPAGRDSSATVTVLANPAAAGAVPASIKIKTK